MLNINTNTNIKEGWKNLLKDDFESQNFLTLQAFLKTENKAELKGETKIFPKETDILNAFIFTPLNSVKVVIIGQDPYHSSEKNDTTILPHAHGLSFSVPHEAKKIPPSLKNIFKEIKADLGYNIPTHGNLTKWTKQGVLLLNATLTVRKGEAGSHQKKGWEQFTDAAIKKLSDKKTGLVFLLWGKFAQNKETLIDITKHTVLKTTHPSPFSAYRGFLGCGHFSTTNKILKAQNQEEIDWEIK